jgi:DNA (cytosine-5)-methyltransferase 1
MRFGSVCSGIEAASVAWGPLGWTAAWFSEIEPFPCAVLKHHYPDVPNLGDMTKLPDLIRSGQVEVPDLLCGGTPCQAFSVAGLRQSLDDERGNLSLTFCEIADAIDEQRKSIIFWENVPGVLSTKDNAFGCFLGALAGEDDALVPPGGRWANAGFVDGPKRAVAWRVLDAQYFGVAQRRRRVFVVASARADFDPAAVLFEFDGVRRDTAPSREAGQGAAHATAPCLTSSGRGVERTGDTRGQDPVVAVCPTIGTGAPFSRTGNARVETDAIISMCLNAGGMGRLDAESETLLPCVAPTIEAVDGRKWGSNQWVNNGKAIVQPIAWSEELTASIDLAGTIQRGGAGGRHDGVAVALRGREGGATAELGDDAAFALRASSGGGDKPHVMAAMQVRRLTPVECERLQGFPDNYTNIKDKCPDGPRYKALGNSWAVPVVRWIGGRINAMG